MTVVVGVVGVVVGGVVVVAGVVIVVVIGVVEVIGGGRGKAGSRVDEDGAVFDVFDNDVENGNDVGGEDKGGIS